MSIAIIVEGKNDKSRLKRVVDESVMILCTFGTPSSLTLEELKKKSGGQVTSSSSRIMMLPAKKYVFCCEKRFQTLNIYIHAEGYAGVEGTPEEYIIQQLEKAGLDEYIIYPAPDPAFE